MNQDIHKDVTVTSRGQLTLPATIRRAMKLGSKRKVRVTISKSGEVSLRPLPEVMTYFGALKSSIPYDPKEKLKARDAMGPKGMGLD
jgi:AbrB family looped-hinge helix DNA binding protein